MMSSCKNIWVITHDNHIDQRILFVVKSLFQKGCRVRLFAGKRFSIFDDDHDSTIRPYNHQEYKISDMFQYNYNKKDISISEHQELEVVKSIIAGFDLEEIRVSRVVTKKIGVYKCCGVVDNEGIVYLDILNIQTKVHLRWNTYDKEIEKVSLPLVYNGLAFACYYDKQIQLTPGAFSILGDFYKNALISEVDKAKVSFYKNRIYSGDVDNYSIINLENHSFSVSSSLLSLTNGNIEFQNKKFEFNDFCEIIYDFTPIFQSVSRFIDEKPDCVYVTDLPTLPIGYILKETLGIKLVVDCHEWWKGQSVLWEPDAIEKIKLIDKYEKFLYSVCDKRITVGEQLANLLQDYFLLPFEHFYTVSDHLVKISDASMSNNDDPDLEKNIFWNDKFGLPKNAKVCIFQGSLTTNRNIENLVRSVDYFEDNHYLVIVGDGPIASSLKSLSDKLHKKGQIIFAGWVMQEDLLAFSTNAEVGIIPYLSINDYYATSSPNKLSEYYASKVPIIADFSMKEICNNIIRDGVGLEVDCTQPNILGKSISKLLSDDDLIKLMKKNYEKKLKIFNEPVQKEKMLDIILNY